MYILRLLNLPPIDLPVAPLNLSRFPHAPNELFYVRHEQSGYPGLSCLLLLQSYCILTNLC